jgi:hypothetical protein
VVCKDGCNFSDANENLDMSMNMKILINVNSYSLHPPKILNLKEFSVVFFSVIHGLKKQDK